MADIFEIINNEFHNLRSNAVNFHIPKPKTSFLKKSISYSETLRNYYGIACQFQQKNRA